MGKLIVAGEEDAKNSFNIPHHYSHGISGPGHWVVDDLPNKFFRVSLAIQREHLIDDRFKEKSNSLRIEVRRFIERNLRGDVYLEYLTKDYWTERKHTVHTWETVRNEIRHGYFILWFEDENDQLLFKLRFGEYISEIVDKIPGREYY